MTRKPSFRETFPPIAGFVYSMKKSMLVYSLALAGLIISPTLASAQNRGPRTVEERVNALKESLKLSDEQVAKVKPIFEKNQEKTKALREDTNLSQDDRRTKMQELYKGLEDEVKPILTPEQQAKYKEENDKRRAQRGQGRAPQNK
jgi:Spy/CpxP family protein refolding chaperone